MRYKATLEIQCPRCNKLWAQPKHYIRKKKCPYCGAVNGLRYTRNSCKL